MLANVALTDKYEAEEGRVYLTGIQALVRMLLVQADRDRRAGLNTAGYVSGYRGSPLGGVDQALWQAKPYLEQRSILFRPGVNEDLAATAIWGTQQVEAAGGAKYDGVFSLWYGKGPGVDRSGDVFKHGNAAGSSRHGGVLLVAGDDHAAKSSTLPHQSDYAFVDAGIPVLSPSGVQEFVEFGILGWALSRFSGCWVGFKAVTSAIESSASVAAEAGYDLQIEPPSGFAMPPGGVHLRLTDDWWEPEARLYNVKLPAAQAFIRANRIDRVVLGGGDAEFGIVTSGKGYLDVMEALARLGIDERAAGRLGLAVYKVGMPWPLEPSGLKAFCESLSEVLVIEEKRPLIEDQVKSILANRARPLRILGKTDEHGRALVAVIGELDPLPIACLIGQRLVAAGRSGKELHSRLAALEERMARSAPIPIESFRRPPHYCSGCPHNTSTKVPEGSLAHAGIGCHIMARLMERNTTSFTQMGGEGAQWVGMAPFTTIPHLFQNLGDGTYFHSGILAIRQAVAANVNITYKLLFNDAVAMTGGQPVDGVLTVPDVVRQVAAEGVHRVVVVSDEPEKYAAGALGRDVPVHHRDELDRIQRELRETPGVTVLVYDQTCAAEKRRRRKRGTMADPDRRTFINDLVCEGCGDCSTKSNCLSVVPIETEFGTKRRIDQSSCNKDFSCLNGFCPSFVTVKGGTFVGRSGAPGTEPAFPNLPEPRWAARDQPYGMLVTGVGGTGVVTIGALLGMAAHLEGRGVTVLDMTGAAQKGGAVFSHVRVAPRPDDLHTSRIADGEADLILGCDLVVTATTEVLGRAGQPRTRAIVNSHQTITAEFTRHSPVYRFPDLDLRRRIDDAVGAQAAEYLDAGALATALLGDAIGVNLFMLGYAWQKGLVPVGDDALHRAIELNGVAVEFNTRAFLWGRRAAHDLAAVERVARVREPDAEHHRLSESLDSVVERRVRFLAQYQNQAYADRYRAWVGRVAAAEAEVTGAAGDLAEAVARSLFKLMAYKDEYEVARLYAQTGFLDRIGESYEGDWRVEVHLAPPLFARRDPLTGHLKKRAFGPWILRVFRVLAAFRGLRGTAFDPFGYMAERRTERQLIADYEALLTTILLKLNPGNITVAVELARIPDMIRGFGHLKEANIGRAKARRAELIDALDGGGPLFAAAAE